MTQRRGDERPGPQPHELAAYADGELGPTAQRNVEAWLASHPEAAASLDEQAKLTQLWQSASPPLPTEADWGALLHRIEAALPGRVPAGRPSRWRLGYLAVVAATLLLGLTLAAGGGALLLRNGPPVVTDPQDDEPFAVVSPEDVEIISMDGDDVGALVVGAPPVRYPLVLVSAGDVTLESNEARVDDMYRIVGMGDGSKVPMILAPLADAGKDE